MCGTNGHGRELHHPAVYRFAPDWKEEHALSHLANARGILHADGYKGHAKLYQPEPDGVPRLRGKKDQRAFQ